MNSMERFTSSLWSILCFVVSLEFLTILIARRLLGTILEKCTKYFLLLFFIPLIPIGNMRDECIGNSRA
jgi:hypothetical protein